MRTLSGTELEVIGMLFWQNIWLHFSHEHMCSNRLLARQRTFQGQEKFRQRNDSCNYTHHPRLQWKWRKSKGSLQKIKNVKSGKQKSMRQLNLADKAGLKTVVTVRHISSIRMRSQCFSLGKQGQCPEYKLSLSKALSCENANHLKGERLNLGMLKLLLAPWKYQHGNYFLRVGTHELI